MLFCGGVGLWDSRLKPDFLLSSLTCFPYAVKRFLSQGNQKNVARKIKGLQDEELHVSPLHTEVGESFLPRLSLWVLWW